MAGGSAGGGSRRRQYPRGIAMTAHRSNAESDLEQKIIEFDQKLQASLAERDDLLLQRNATAEILKVINGSPGDLAPVFDKVLEKATLLCGAGFSALAICKGNDMHQIVAMRGLPPSLANMFHGPIHLGPETGLGRLVRGEPFVHIADASDDEGYRLGNPVRRALVDLAGARTYLAVPIRSDDVLLGSFTIYRREVRPFAAELIALLQSFADQAAIAIQNARLFNASKEALERQTATADILKVIAASPSDVQPVFEAIAENANRLVGGLTTAVHSLVDDTLHLTAFTPTTPEADATLQATYPQALATLPWGKKLRNGEVVEVQDTVVEWATLPNFRDVARTRGFRSILRVPMLRDGVTIGVINVSRMEPGPFSDHHVQLLQTFADQGVIAIENVRLFTETQEALERQTATADILRVISNSPGDVQPVFDTVAEHAARICGAQFVEIMVVQDDAIRREASFGNFAGLNIGETVPLDRTSVMGRSICDREPVHLADPLAAGDEFPGALHFALRFGHRTTLAVPLLRESRALGTILVRRTEVRPFEDKHIALLKTFADQAAIAIENARLFNETQEALERQTATADILKVIASSPSDVQPVFDAIAERSNRLAQGLSTTVQRLVDDTLHIMAFTRTSPEADAALQASFPRPLSGFPWGERIRRGEIVHIPDVEVELAEFPVLLEVARLRGFRSMLFVPLQREGAVIGIISVTQVAPGRFADRHVQLLQTFADQAAIAIGNVRLFDEVQARTRELAASLEDLRSAQDRLVQTEKLASLGQLTAGIAHEIKNPLNFVNNFSALSAELTDELNDLLNPAPLADKMREDVDELTRLLKDNLIKVVQHGKRANSIVKNMLLHSREGAGEQRLADINALLDESLNLAYHGARAEKSGFNITLQRDFDANAGSIQLFPQEITRAFLNLISNGFYAATMRKAENGEANFEPMLWATTKNLGSAVEIRIRDNGSGIPAEVKEKMFNPFFTTKPAGEGTGLGLSMSHDIIVKQHGGRIDVETEPGQFTEFTIVLPRTHQSSKSN